MSNNNPIYSDIYDLQENIINHYLQNVDVKDTNIIDKGYEYEC
jgi:hypothetical protein